MYYIGPCVLHRSVDRSTASVGAPVVTDERRHRATLEREYEDAEDGEGERDDDDDDDDARDARW